MQLNRWPLMAVLAMLLVATGPASAGGDAPSYDMNSWQTMIADDCRAFFDGCNQCVREPGKPAACTRMACMEYRKPVCRDDEAGAQSTSRPEPKTVDYVCADGDRISVIYNELRTDDMRVHIAENEIMLRDLQTRTVYRLERERSASGEKYVSKSGLQFFGKGDEALVLQNNERLYSDCRTGN